MSDSISIGWFGPTHNQWDWILGHFHHVTFLTERNVEDWLASQSQASEANQTNATPVFIAVIESRFEPAMDLVKGLNEAIISNSTKALSIPWCVLLGDDWVGHRRTYPLPETMQTFYWYEWYDRIFPWLVDQSHGRTAKSITDPDASIHPRKLSPRVQRVIDASLSMDNRLRCNKSNRSSIKMALVVTETATTRQLWCDALSSYEIQCVATTPENLELWANPDILVVDIESEPWIVRERQQEGENGCARGSLVRRLASQFPKATMIVADAFPRWDTWKALHECGADLMVAKPFQLPGILDTLENSEVH